MALISVVLERTLYARLYGASELEQVLFTIGLIFMSVAVVALSVGAAAAADAPAGGAQRPDRSRLPQLPDLSHVPDRGAAPS